MIQAYRRFARLTSATVYAVGIALTLPCVAVAEDPSTSGVAYISGGVGESGRAEIEAVQAQYSLKLVFAYTNGEFLAGVDVVITDAAGNTLVAADADGPWLLVALPAGTYRVAATVGDSTKTEEVSVSAGGLKTVNIQWPPSAN
jgi:hypothetical protein